MDWAYEDDECWDRTLRMTPIKSLTGLRSLRLRINHYMSAALYQSAKVCGNELGLYQIRQLQFVEKLATLSLTDVKVFVSDNHDILDAFDDGDPARRCDLAWTAEDRTEFAEGIRKIILDPKGADIYAQRQKA